MYRTVFLQTLIQLTARSLTTISNFLVLLLVAVQFGTFGVGQYNKVFALVAICSLFTDFGINAIFVKDSKKNEKLLSLVFLRLIIAGIVFLGIQLFFYILPISTNGQGFSGQERMFATVASLTLFLYAFSQSFNAVFQKFERFHLQILPMFFLAGSILGSGIVGYSLHNLSFFFWGTVVGWFVYDIVAAIEIGVVFKGQIQEIFAVHKKDILNLFLLSLPLGITLLLNTLYVRIDTLILTFLRSTSDVGIYTLAYKFFDVPLTLSFYVMNSLYPVFLKHKDDEHELKKVVTKFLWIIMVISFFIMVAGYFGAPLLMLINKEFIQSILPFRILILSYPIFFASNVVLWLLITKNKEKFLPLIYGGVLILNGTLNIFFVPMFGYIASAWITVFSEVIVLLLLLLILRLPKKKI